MPRKSKPQPHGHCRIVLTGGPGGGKSTAGDLFRREMDDQVVLVPEAATMMFTGGFPRVNLPEAVHAAQRAIYHVQIHLEEAVKAQHPEQIGNPIRNESIEQAIKLDRKLRDLWSQHPKFMLVPHNPSFFKKISFGLAVLDGMVSELGCQERRKKR